MKRTRKEVEAIIRTKMAEINDAVKEYDPDASYLTLSIIDGWVSFNSDYYNPDTKEINWHGPIEECAKWTRKEFEAFMRGKLLEIYAAWKEYDEAAKYLTMCFYDMGDHMCVSFNNDYFEPERRQKADWTGTIEECAK